MKITKFMNAVMMTAAITFGGGRCLCATVWWIVSISGPARTAYDGRICVNIWPDRPVRPKNI